MGALAEECEDLLEELGTAALGAIKVDVVGGVGEGDEADLGRVGGVGGEEFRVGGARPEVALGAQVEGPRADQGGIPELPAGSEVEAVL